ncbi:Flagellin (modular protein) [Alphaproteobacteria bacterium]
MTTTIHDTSFTHPVKWQLSELTKKINLYSQKLVSGDKITETWEDPAIVTITDGLKSLESKFSELSNGLQQAQSVLYIADGGISKLISTLNIMENLAIRAKNGSFGDTQRAALNTELQELVKSLDTITTNTLFNGIKLLDGSIDEGSNLVGNTKGIVTSSTGTLTYSVSPAATPSTFTLNGVRFATGTTAAVPTTTQELGLTINPALDLAADTTLMVINGVTIGYEGTNKGTADTATLLNIQRQSSVEDLAVAVAAAITVEHTTPVLLFAGATSYTTGNTVYINNVGITAGAGKYSFTPGTATHSEITAATKDGTPITITSGTADATSLTDVTIPNVVAAADATAMTAYFAAGGGLQTANADVRAALSGLSVTNVGGIITVTSKNNTEAGMPVVNDLKKTSVGQYDSSTEVGSLGVSNTYSKGTLKGTAGSWFNYNDSRYAKPTTGWVTMPTIIDGTVVNVGNGGLVYTFKQNPNKNIPTEVQLVKDDVHESLLSLISAVNESGHTALQGLDFELKTQNSKQYMRITGRTPDTTLNGLRVLVGTTPLILDGGKTGGINLSKVMANDQFVGSGAGLSVSAKFRSANTVDLTIATKNGISYTALNVSTKPAADTSVTFSAGGGKVEGGYFSMQFIANQGMVVGDTDAANIYAEQISEALAGLTFYQSRDLENFEPDPNGILSGATAAFVSSSFSDSISVSTIKVDMKSASNNGAIVAKLSDGREFSFVKQLTDSSFLPGGSMLELWGAKTKDANEKILIHILKNVNLSNPEDVSALKLALTDAFKAGKGAMSFPISPDTKAMLMKVSISSLTTEKLFKGATIDIADKNNISSTEETIGKIIEELSTQRTKIGAYQMKTNQMIESFNIETKNIAAAKSVYGDTDMPTAVEEIAKRKIQLTTAVSTFKQMLEVIQQIADLVHR